MYFRPSTRDFSVEELVQLPTGPGGGYSVYRLQKWGITTLQAQQRLAAALNVAPSSVAFPALKDKEARSIQYGTVRSDGPAEVHGSGFRAERVGRSIRPLSARDMIGNRFGAVLHDLSQEQARAVGSKLEGLQTFGFPNYFDQQRFGSYAAGQDMVGKRILLRDAEGALRAYLSQAFAGDPAPVRAWKAEAQAHWGEWRHLLETAPKPSNFRSVLTFLVDHPDDYRRALNLVTPRLLSLYLAAYQSRLWNRLVGRYVSGLLKEVRIEVAGMLAVAGEPLPFYSVLPEPVLNRLRAVHVPLHQQRMTIADPKLAALSAALLAEEGIQREDLKARLLTKAYLSRGTRPVLAFPRQATASSPTPDDAAARRCRLVVSFVLLPGSYATLLLRILLSRCSRT